MKVLIINGSPRINGNTSIALNEMIKIFKEEKIEIEYFQIGSNEIKGCKACNFCHLKNEGCIYKDIVNDLSLKLKESNGLVIASPVYYASPNGSLISLLDRLFYSSNFDLKMKVGASVVVARRGGSSSAFDFLNKYFTISEMPVVSSIYWNMVYGRKPGEASEDKEGLQTMRVLARNMIFLMKSIELGKKEIGLPEDESISQYTNFIR